MMKTYSAAHASQRFRALRRDAQDWPVLITHYGSPELIVVGVAGGSGSPVENAVNRLLVLSYQQKGEAGDD